MRFHPLRATRSLAGRMALAWVALALIAVPVGVASAYGLHSLLLGTLAGLLVSLPLAMWLAKRSIRRWTATIHALRNGLDSLNDQDYSVSVAGGQDPELDGLVQSYNLLGESLRKDRLGVYQRELLLDTVIQATPVALALTNPHGTVLYSNTSARQLLNDGRKLEGHRLDSLLQRAPEGLRQSLGEALAQPRDTLCTVEINGNNEVLHVSQRHFLLNTQPHRLLLLKQLTQELAAQESRIWKKVIRVIAHELNNSLAPISSLAHSGLLLADAPDRAQLTRVFRTIEERANHLAAFIDGYARFSKLPQPRLTAMRWTDVLERVGFSTAFRVAGDLPSEPLHADAAQIEQVLINLLKNAAESGSAADAITLQVQRTGEHFVVQIADRGLGLAPDVLANALLPFFSTKASGTGIGLTLCREIIEAHGGRILLANRDGGGAVVTVWLPAIVGMP